MGDRHMDDWDAAHTCLVTVTYGNRAHLLDQCLEAALGQNRVGRAIVVRNGPVPGIDDVLRRWAGRIEGIGFARNVGSAKAFAAGIEAALRGDSRFFVLLDDDNIIAPGGVNALLSEIRTDPEGMRHPERLAALGWRHDGASFADVPARSSFLNFRLGRKPGRRETAAALPFAPYGGLLAHRDLFAAIGLPRPDMVLYADDTEYTSRIVKAGGRIAPVEACKICDADQSWNRAAVTTSYLVRLLEEGSDFRVYYSIRNRVWFDSRLYVRNYAVYALNALVFCASLAVVMVRRRRFARGAVLARAIAHGLLGRLGANPAFPLP